MSSSQTPVGFTVQEIYTRILPGLVLVLSFSIPIIITNAIEGRTIDIPLTTTNLILLTGLLSLVVGEFINIIRELMSVPQWFRLIVYKETEDKSDLGWGLRLLLKVWPLSIVARRTIDNNTEYITEIVESTTLEDDLYEDICNKIGFEPKSVKPYLLYMGLMNHMDSQMSSLTERQRMNYTFTENVWIALVLGMAFHLFVVIVHLFGKITNIYGASVNIILVSSIVLIILVIVHLIWVVFLNMASGLYLQYLLINYLSDNSQYPDENHRRRTSEITKRSE